MAQEVKYVPKGEKGRTCGDCRFFERDSQDSARGLCFGHEVLAEGACNLFEAKQ